MIPPVTKLDLPAFVETLPIGRARNSVIRSKVRLRAESNRQQGFVSSEFYLRRVMKGTVVVASLVIDGKRWTVELTGKKDSENDFGITRIRGRSNELPKMIVIRTVYAVYLSKNLKLIERL